MIFTATPVGAVVIDPERLSDDRGFFARSFCAREFEAHGLNPCVAQCNVSFNPRRGTVRGMHFQRPPHAEAKLVSCTAGALWDVALDGLRQAELEVIEPEGDPKEFLRAALGDPDDPQPVVVTLIPPFAPVIRDHAVVVLAIRAADASGLGEMVEFADPLDGQIKTEPFDASMQCWEDAEQRACIIRP